MVHDLSKQGSIFSQYISEIRDEKIQKDPLRFRRNLERMGEIFAYEISKTLEYTKKETQTPLGIAESQIINEQPVLATILRAGLPLHHGMLNIFDQAQNAFISAYRKHHKDNTFEVKVEYLASPPLDNRILILADPMLATGTSLILSYQGMLQRGTPKHVHLVSLIASRQGVEYIKSHMPGNNYTLWVGAIDEELTAQSYIVPGLGDAGDLAYGEKV
jgi:uracil phosphoribosyltransferase